MISMREASDENSTAPTESPSAREADAVTEGAEPAEPAEAPVRYVADEVLLGSTDLARSALLEVTAIETIGPVMGHTAEDEHVLSLQFAADVAGYPGWHWSVTLARVEGADPTVVETQLLPGDGALVAPEWLPWSERLAEYRAAQKAAAIAAGEGADADSAEDDERSEDSNATDADGNADESDGDDEFDDDSAGENDDEHDADDDDHGDDVFDGIDIDALDSDDTSDVDDSHGHGDGDSGESDGAGDDSTGADGSPADGVDSTDRA